MNKDQIGEIEDAVGQMVSMTTQMLGSARRCNFWQEINPMGAALLVSECRRLLVELSHIEIVARARGLSGLTDRSFDQSN